jgi:hypothetical protein
LADNPTKTEPANKAEVKVAKVAPKELNKRREAAKHIKQVEIQSELDDAYRWAIPYRKSSNDNKSQDSTLNHLFDHTALVSAFRFGGRVHQDFFPPGQQNFVLEPGALVPEAERETLQKTLSLITKIVSSAFMDGEFDQSIHEAGIDLGAGTAAILTLPGGDDRIARFVTVPIAEVALELGPYGAVDGIFWHRKWVVRNIRKAFPKATFGQKLALLEKEKPEDEVILNQDTLWDAAAKRWVLHVSAECDAETVIHTSSTRSCPWATPRYFRLSGQVWGRGPINLAMPAIKTLNTAQRLTLQGAAIAMLGIYTVVDDQVFNPDLAVPEPGAFWRVARNGGPLGPSVTRFPDPQMDTSAIVIEKLQMAVQSALMDQSLPPDGAAVRSATEIMERVRRLASDHMGAFGRLVHELVVPLVRHVIELAYEAKLIPTDLTIDQLLIKVRVTSPIAIAREAEKVERMIQMLTILVQFMGQRADRIVHLEKVLLKIMRLMGFDDDDLVTDKERAAKDNQEAALAAAAMAAGGGVESDMMAQMTGQAAQPQGAM